MGRRAALLMEAMRDKVGAALSAVPISKQTVARRAETVSR